MAPDPGHEGEGVESHPVRPEAQDLVQVGLEGLQLLLREAVDEIQVDPLGEPDLPGILHEIRRLLVGLVPGDGLLDLRGQILDPHAQPVEPQLHQAVQVVMRGHPGIHLDGHLRPSANSKCSRYLAMRSDS